MSISKVLFIDGHRLLGKAANHVDLPKNEFYHHICWPIIQFPTWHKVRAESSILRPLLVTGVVGSALAESRDAFVASGAETETSKIARFCMLTWFSRP